MKKSYSGFPSFIYQRFGDNYLADTEDDWPIFQDEAHAETARLVTSRNYAEALEVENMKAAAKGRTNDWAEVLSRYEGRGVERRRKRGAAYPSSPVNYNDDGRWQKRKRMRSPSSSASSLSRLRRSSPTSPPHSIRQAANRNSQEPRNRVYHILIHLAFIYSTSLN
jgi:hypothetical protein